MDGDNHSITQRNIRIFKKGISFIAFVIIPVFYAIETILNWNQMNVCVKREAAFVGIFLFYLRFSNPANPSFLLDLVQILGIIWIIQRANNADYGLDAECTDAKGSTFAYSTEVIFQLLLWVYTIMCICVLVLLVGLIFFSILEVFYYRPRRIRRQGISRDEYLKLKRVEFKKEDLGDNTNLDTCSICLEDFVEKQMVTQMPGCKHNFHESCVKGWLDYHSICPNCRSDLRENFRAEGQA